MQENLTDFELRAETVKSNADNINMHASPPKSCTRSNVVRFLGTISQCSLLHGTVAALHKKVLRETRQIKAFALTGAEGYKLFPLKNYQVSGL